MRTETLETRTIAGLNCVVKTSSLSGDQTGAPCVVMLHGYGADCHDLAPLADAVAVPAGTTWVFPDAPLSVPIGPHMLGKAWFPIDMAALEEAMMLGRHRDFSQLMPLGMADAADKVKGLIQALECDWSNVFLGGFSQGGMLACELALQAETSPKGLFMLSSTLVCQERWDLALRRHRDLRVLLSHGFYDPLLSFHDAERLRDLLLKHGATVDFVPFDGGHEIPMPVIRALSQLINQ